MHFASPFLAFANKLVSFDFYAHVVIIREERKINIKCEHHHNLNRGLFLPVFDHGHRLDREVALRWREEEDL